MTPELKEALDILEKQPHSPRRKQARKNVEAALESQEKEIAELRKATDNLMIEETKLFSALLEIGNACDNPNPIEAVNAIQKILKQTRQAVQS